MEHNYSIDSVTLNVNNLDGMTKFYEETIGLEVLNRNEVRSELGGLGSTAPILTLLKSEAKQRKQNTGLYHFALLLDSRKALGSFFDSLIGDSAIRLMELRTMAIQKRFTLPILRAMALKSMLIRK